jgi:ABC-2 type transport system permease protein
MAVYEREWRRYLGPLSSVNYRFLVMTRYALKDAFHSKLFTMFYTACFIPILIGVFLIYIRHNLALIEAMGFPEEFMEGLTITFFAKIFLAQAIPAFFLAVLIGPALVSPDLASNNLSLILSRPISRTGYVTGKLAVMFLLISPITWMGGLFMFGLNAYLEGGSWWSDNLRIVMSQLVGHFTWLAVISLLALAISAWVRYKWAARAVMLAALFAMWAFGGLVNNIVGTTWGSVIDMMSSIVFVVAKIFDPEVYTPVPVWASWCSLLVYSAFSLWLLSRKLRAHEVVK